MTAYKKERLNAAAVVRGNPDFDAKTPNFLLGNGRFGGCPDAFSMGREITGDHQSYLWHPFHVELGRGNLECRVPLLLYGYRICKARQELPISPQTVTDYCQTLSLYEGMLITRYTLLEKEQPVAKLHIEQYISPAAPYHVGWDIMVEPLAGPLTLTFDVEMLDSCISQHDIPISYPVTASQTAGTPILTSTTSRGKTHTALTDGAKQAQQNGNTLILTYDIESKTTVHPAAILINDRENRSVEKAVKALIHTPPTQRKESHRKAWQAFWEKGFVDPADPELFGIWARFLYCMGASAGTENSVPLSPGGLAGSGLWPFEFPQDYHWMYESFFTANHPELAAGTARYWNTILEQVRTFTKKYLEVDGTFFPWVPSNFDLKEMPRPAFDPPYAYQLHNAAYPLRMCYLYWQFTKDTDYLQSILPVAEGVADFYTAISTYMPETGKYEIHFKPCMGQDEFGSFNRVNYLCCMLSAAYSVKIANELYHAGGKPPKKEWEHIETVGYAFEKLKTTGLFATYEGGPTPNPQQKHPSQLNALAALPLPEIYESKEFKETYRRRYEISLAAEQNFWSGWSLGTFLIASVRMADPKECEKDFTMLMTNRDADKPQLDKENIQMYETGGYHANCSYFHTAMAMVVTAITELFVQSFDGTCKVFPVILPAAADKKVSFDNLLTPFDCTLSGQWEKGKATVSLCVNRKTAFTLELGADCKGDYVLTDREGKTVAVSENNRFVLDLAPGEYLIIS